MGLIGNGAYPKLSSAISPYHHSAMVIWLCEQNNGLHGVQVPAAKPHKSGNSADNEVLEPINQRSDLDA